MTNKLEFTLGSLASFAEFSKLLLNGTYVGLRVHNKDLVEEIQNAVLPEDSKPHDDLHATVIYSKGRGKIPQFGGVRSYRATITGFELFGEDRDCLVLTIFSPEVEALHAEMKAQGLTHTWPEFQGHVTLSYDYTGDLPDCSPWVGQQIIFSEPYFDCIDEDYS